MKVYENISKSVDDRYLADDYVDLLVRTIQKEDKEIIFGVSYVQRKLGLGYNAAFRLIEGAEARDFIKRDEENPSQYYLLIDKTKRGKQRDKENNRNDVDDR